MSTTTRPAPPPAPPTTPAPAPARLSSRLGRQSVFALAVGQLVAAALLGPGGGQPGGADAPDLLVTPAGWTFAIWGVVIAGCLAYGAYQLSSRRGDLPALATVAWPLAGAQVGFLAWLVAAEVAPAWATVVVLAVMVALLAVAYTRALAARRSMPLAARLILLNTLGIFTAWSAAALPINVASALAAAGLPVSGAGAAWQLLVLAAVGAVGVGVVLRWRARLASTVTVVWALVGVAAGAGGRGEVLVAALAGTGALVLLTWAAWWRWNDVRQRVEAFVASAGGRGSVVPGVVVDLSGGVHQPRDHVGHAVGPARRPDRGRRS